MTTLSEQGGQGGSESPGEPATPPRARRRHRRRWSVWAGVVSILVGIGLLGYLAWEIYGTDVVSHRRHREIVSALRRQWDRPGGAAGVTTAAGPARAIVRIPRFGASYAVPIIEGTSEDALAAGFGHYRGTAGPGEVGNFALAGHRITHGEPLAGMPDLRVGDTVDIETRDHTYVYVLDTAGDSLRVPFTDTWVVDRRPVNPDGGIGPTHSARLLTLTTCAELFHTDDRLVAFGHLVRVEAPTGSD